MNQFGNATNLKMHYVWRDSWIDKWSEEFFCDLFATLTLGPAFVWSNLHMCVKMDWNLYQIPRFAKTSHPPSAARMQAMFHALDLIGFDAERKKIEKQWNEFIKVIDTRPDQEYHIALPDKFLRLSASYALEGVKALKCKLASDNMDALIIKTLNDAWDGFWKNPLEFSDKELLITKALKTRLS